MSEAVGVPCRARAELKDQYAYHRRGRNVPVDLSDLLPAPGRKGAVAERLGPFDQGEAQGRLLVGEQTFLQAAGESAGVLVWMG